MLRFLTKYVALITHRYRSEGVLAISHPPSLLDSSNFQDYAYSFLWTSVTMRSDRVLSYEGAPYCQVQDRLFTYTELFEQHPAWVRLVPTVVDPPGQLIDFSRYVTDRIHLSFLAQHLGYTFTPTASFPHPTRRWR